VERSALKGLATRRFIMLCSCFVASHGESAM
jgi:hypothetical protein